MSKQQQVRNAGIYLIPTIISMILPIISLPIILNYLSPSEFGAYTLSFAFGSVVVGFCQLSLLGVYERDYFSYTNNKEKAQLLFTIVSFVFFIMMTVGAFIFVNKDYIASWIAQNNEYGLLLFITFIGLMFQSSGNYYLSFLKNTGNAKLNVSIILLTSILGFILNIYFVSILKIGPIGLSLGLLISNGIIFCLVTIYLLKILDFGLNRRLLISSLKLSYPLVPTGVLSVIGKYYDKYIISVLSTVGGVGIYAISQRISNLSFLFMTAIQKVYGPVVYSKMFSNNYDKGDKEIGKYLTPFAYFSVAGSLMVSLFSEEALFVLAPPEYFSGLSVVNILVISLSLGFFTKQPQIMYASKTKILSILTFVNFICTIFILYYFVNSFGLLGAAIGYLLVSIIYNALYVFLGQKYYKIEYEWVKLLAIYGMLFFMGFSVIILRAWDFTYINRLIIKISYGGIFIGLGMYLNIINRENLLLLIYSKKAAKI